VESESLLVLKSSFNDAWNNVSTSVLFDRITSHWFYWAYCLENNLLGKEGYPYPVPEDFARLLLENDDWADIMREKLTSLEPPDLPHADMWMESLPTSEVVGEEDKQLLCSGLISVLGPNAVGWAFDARTYFGNGKGKLLVSRKRNRNLGDLVNTWRNSIMYSVLESSRGDDAPLFDMSRGWQTYLEKYGFESKSKR
jgi:hypothetical protein